MERSICDIIRSSSRIDHDLIKRAVKKYLKRKDKENSLFMLKNLVLKRK